MLYTEGLSNVEKLRKLFAEHSGSDHIAAMCFSEIMSGGERKYFYNLGKVHKQGDKTKRSSYLFFSSDGFYVGRLGRERHTKRHVSDIFEPGKYILYTEYLSDRFFAEMKRDAEHIGEYYYYSQLNKKEWFEYLIYKGMMELIDRKDIVSFLFEKGKRLFGSDYEKIINMVWARHGDQKISHESFYLYLPGIALLVDLMLRKNGSRAAKAITTPNEADFKIWESVSSSIILFKGLDPNSEEAAKLKSYDILKEAIVKNFLRPDKICNVLRSDMYKKIKAAHTGKAQR